MYIFTFDAWNKDNNSSSQYSSITDTISLRLIADTEDEALALAKSLITREIYVLDGIYALTDKHSA